MKFKRFLALLFTTFLFHSYESLAQQLSEKQILSQYPKLVKKTKNGYEVFTSKGTRFLENETGEDGPYEVYHLNDFYTDLGYLFFTISQDESSSAEMLNIQTGESFIVGNYPTISPDKKSLFVISSDMSMMESGINGVVVFKILPTGLKKIKFIDLQSAEFISWIDPYNAKIISGEFEGDGSINKATAKTLILHYDKESDQWDVLDNGKKIGPVTLFDDYGRKIK